MKTLKLSIICIAFVVSFGNCLAQNIERIYMNSGSVLEGYIAEQKYKQITIATTKATIVVSNDSLQSRATDFIPYDALSKEWKEWAEENNKFTTSGRVKQLELTTLQFPNKTYSKVFLLEKGSLLKFVDVAPNSYTFAKDGINRTVKNNRPKNLFSGISEILVLQDNSEVEGQIIEQFPGKDLKIETVQGEVLSYKYDQIKQIKSVKFNKKLDLWSQIQLLDKIGIKDTGEELVGFISSRTLKKELTFEFENGSRRTVPLDKVSYYAKIANDKYVAAYDKVLKEGEVLLNGNLAYFDTLKVIGDYMILGEFASIQVKAGETICIEANLPDNNATISLVKAHYETISMGKEKNKRESIYTVITYQDLIKSYIPIERENTALGNIRFSFKVSEVGDYVLYLQGKEGYIVINVIE